MECSECGSYRHNTSSCPGPNPHVEHTEKGYLCPKCGRAWGQDNYAIECCTTKGDGRR